MKLFHLSDLHLGKRVNEFSMLEDQEYILTKIINIIDEETPDAVLIAGDIYDKSVPPAEAVGLFDDFLYRLSRRRIKVFIISGNHDCAERIAFGSRLMDRSGIHMSPVYNGQITPILAEDEFGPVYIYMLPFVKPVHVRRFFPEEEIESYTDAVRAAIGHMNVEPSKRNILVAHQFVTGAVRSESEDVSVGGLDNVDASVYEPFDYVALGHIHRPQNIGKETVRYSGTPLKYSFSEANHVKSITCVDMLEKGNVRVRTIPLEPRHDLREIKGSYLELTARSYYEGTKTDDYIHITLTDEEDIPDAIGKLRVIYPNLMRLDYDNRRTRSSAQIGREETGKQKSPLTLFEEFYELQNGQPMSTEQAAFAEKIIREIWEDER